MKYAVIGQSNTLVRGNFVEQLRDDYPEHEAVALGRLGASYSIILPYFAHDGRFFNGASFCIIDVCVVDAGQFAGGSYDISRSRLCLEWIGHQCRKYNCEPIFLLIGVLPHLRNPTERSNYFDMFMNVVNNGDYLYINTMEIVTEIGNESKSGVESCYDDAWHLNAETFSEVARILNFLFNNPPTPGADKMVTTKLPMFSTVSATPVAEDFERTAHVSSALRFDGVKVPLGQTLSVYCGSGMPIAIMVNVSGTHATAKISGTGEALEDFDIVPYSTRDFEARLVNLSKDIAPSESGHISFTPQAVASPKKRPYPPRFQGLEVGDVMVQSPPEEVIYSYRPPQGERNILKRFKEAGQALNTAGNPTAFTYSPTDIAEHARASGLAAEVVAKVEGGVVRVTPLAPDAMLRLPAAISNFSGRISARASTATRSVGALKIMVDGNPVAELPLGDVTRTYYFSGSGHEISIISDIPSASYIIKKIVLRDAWSQ